MSIYINRVTVKGTGRDGIHITADPSTNEGPDGIALTVEPSADIHLQDCVTENCKRHGVYINVRQKEIEINRDSLTSAGLASNTPVEEIEHAYDVLTSRKCVTELDKEKTLKEIGFTKYVTRGANLATIASLIIQLITTITSK